MTPEEQTIVLDKWRKDLEERLYEVLYNGKKIPYTKEGYEEFLEIIKKNFPAPPEFEISIQPYEEITSEQRRHGELPVIMIKFL